MIPGKIGLRVSMMFVKSEMRKSSVALYGLVDGCDNPILAATLEAIPNGDSSTAPLGWAKGLG
jgi:hypothetical protein